MLRLFQKFGMNEISCIYAQNLHSDLSNTIFQAPSYPFPNLTPILKLCQIIISLHLPTVIFNSHHGNCVLPLHRDKFII